MQVADIQRALIAAGRQIGAADGIPGRKTMGTIDDELGVAGIPHDDWTDARKLVAMEQLIYKDLKIEAGPIDGLVGEQVRYARSVWDARPSNSKTTPNPNVENWRDKPTAAVTPPPRAVADTAARQNWPRQKDVQSFYGAPGSGFESVLMPLKFRIAWQPETTVQKISMHKKCAEAFAAVWEGALDHYGFDHLQLLRLDMFGGCVNVRKMRGGSSWSMHAFGCAWDVDPDRNQLKFHRAQAELDDSEYAGFWDIVYKQGAMSLGREKDYDWMHFQFTRDFS